MERISGKLFFSFRLLVSVLLLSCLSPVPEAPGNKPFTFSSYVASLSGPLRLVIWKSQYTLTLYKGDRPVKTYRAAFGRGFRDGDKRKSGDKRTPEGEFYICTMNHSKRFYKFMGLSYPDVKHAESGLREKLISPGEYTSIRQAIEERQQPPWGTRLGGAVGIHGRMLDGAAMPEYYSVLNWTDGCIALDNADVDEIFSIASLGTPVTILP
jgi:murein L,D-transpeptidase YafK